MSNYTFTQGQPVHVLRPYNQFQPCSDTVYHIGAISRIQGLISCQLLLNGSVVGAIDQSCLTEAKTVKK